MRSILFLFFMGLVLGRPDTVLTYENDECITCHSLQSIKSRLHIDMELFNRSVHAGVSDCVDCHNRLKIENNICIDGSGSVDCNECHDQQNRHGIGGTSENRPECYHCHTRHNILSKDNPMATIHQERLPETCANCHPTQTGQSSYLSWLPSIKLSTHPKADLSGDYSKSNCLECHQGKATHGGEELIREATCYLCHFDVEGQKAIMGFIHPRADLDRQPGVFAVAIIYQIFIILLIVGGIVFFIRKFSGLKGP